MSRWPLRTRLARPPPPRCSSRSPCSASPRRSSSRTSCAAPSTATCGGGRSTSPGSPPSRPGCSRRAARSTSAPAGASCGSRCATATRRIVARSDALRGAAAARRGDARRRARERTPGFADDGSAADPIRLYAAPLAADGRAGGRRHGRGRLVDGRHRGHLRPAARGDRARGARRGAARRAARHRPHGRGLRPLRRSRSGARAISEAPDVGRRLPEAATRDEVGSCPARSTACSTRSTTRARPSAGCWPTRRTSCARRSPRCGATPRSPAATAPTTSCSPTSRPTPSGSRGSSRTCSRWSARRARSCPPARSTSRRSSRRSSRRPSSPRRPLRSRCAARPVRSSGRCATWSRTPASTDPRAARCASR